MGDIRDFLNELSVPFVGREEEARVITLTLLSREHTVLIGEPGCVAGDTIVGTTDGKLFYIDHIAGNLAPGVYPIDLPLLPYGRATQLHIYEVGRLIQIVTLSGQEIKVTYNHPLLTKSGWVRAEDIGEGDMLNISGDLPAPSLPLHYPISLEPHTQKHFRELGKQLAREEVNARYSHHKDMLIISRNAALNQRVRPALNFLNEIPLGFVRGFDEDSEALDLTLNPFVSCGPDGRIPPQVLASPIELSTPFIQGFFEVAGHPEPSAICLEGEHLSFLRGIQILLLRYGIPSRVGDSRELCLGREFNVDNALIIDSCEGIARFAAQIGFGDGERATDLKRMIRKGECIGNEGISSSEYGRVMKVRELRGVFRVYDFHIPKHHAFFSNGFLSHNTAKSAMVRRAAELLNARFFKYLLTRFTEPAELFGPLDIKALEEGRYVRLSKGKLPDAEIAFLDEVFKANSAILNALNSILQERILYDGYTEVSVPLWSLFGASNEVPDDPEVEAVYDRFAARHFVRPLNEELWRELLMKSWDLERKTYFEGGFGGKGILEIGDLRRYHEKVLNADIGPVIPKLTKILAVLEDRGIHISDRRKGKLMKFIAANAVLEGRDKAKETDLIVIKYLVPSNWDELERVEVVLSEELRTSFKYLRELEEMKSNVKEVMNYVLSVQGIESKYIESRFRIIFRDLMTTKDRVLGIVRESDDPKVKALGNEVIELIDNILEIVEKKVS